MPRTDPMDPLSHRGHSAERRRSRQRPNVARGSQRVTQKKIHRLATDTDKPATRRFDLDYASMQRYPEDPKGMYTTARIQGICTPASRSQRWIPSISYQHHLDDVETNFFGHEEVGLSFSDWAARALFALPS